MFKPRSATAASARSDEISAGAENIELISIAVRDVDRKSQQIKDKYPDRILIASIMEEFVRKSVDRIVEKVQEVGV